MLFPYPKTYDSRHGDVAMFHDRLFYAEDLHLRILLNEVYLFTLDRTVNNDFLQGVRGMIINRLDNAYLPALDCLLDHAQEIICDLNVSQDVYDSYWKHLDSLDKILQQNPYLSQGEHFSKYLGDYEDPELGDALVNFCVGAYSDVGNLLGYINICVDNIRDREEIAKIKAIEPFRTNGILYKLEPEELMDDPFGEAYSVNEMYTIAHETLLSDFNKVARLR